MGMCRMRRVRRMRVLAPIVHNELRRLPAPDILSNRGQGHVEREDHVVAQDLVVFVRSWPRVVSSRRGEGSTLDGGAGCSDGGYGRSSARYLLQLVLYLLWLSARALATEENSRYSHAESICAPARSDWQ